MPRNARRKAIDQLDDVAASIPEPQSVVIVDDEPNTEGQPEALAAPVSDAAPSVATAAVSPAVEAAVPPPAPDELATLRKQYEAAQDELRRERERAAEAARRADEFKRQAELDSSQAYQSSIIALDNGLTLTQANIAQAKAAYAEAMRTQRYEDAAEANAALVANNARLAEIRQARETLEVKRQQLQPSRSDTPTDAQIEAHISEFTPQSQAWLRKNKEDIFNTPGRSDLVLAAHQLVVRQGFKPDTDAYFSELDKHMGYNKPAQEAAPASAQSGGSVPTVPRSGSVEAAPVARSGFNQPARTTGGQIQLSKAQAAMALSLAGLDSNSPKADRDRALIEYWRGVQAVDSQELNLAWSADKYRGGYGR